MNPTPASSTPEFKAILLVDDDRDLVNALRDALMSENFLVDAAYDGREAFLKTKVHHYDAVICDLLMPNLRGDELYRQATELHPELASRFLFITGYADDPQVQQFLTSVPAPRLLKPFRIEALINAVRELLGQSR